MYITVADPETSEGGGGAKDMKYKPPRAAAIFLAYFLQARGGMAPLPPPPGSAVLPYIRLYNANKSRDLRQNPLWL